MTASCVILEFMDPAKRNLQPLLSIDLFIYLFIDIFNRFLYLRFNNNMVYEYTSVNSLCSQHS